MDVILSPDVKEALALGFKTLSHAAALRRVAWDKRCPDPQAEIEEANRLELMVLSRLIRDDD
mgnify:CR=1 FL=1